MLVPGQNMVRDFIWMPMTPIFSGCLATDELCTRCMHGHVGFHEDGFTSGIRVAHGYFGAKLPFDIRSPDRRFNLTLMDVTIHHTMRLLEYVRSILAFVLFSVLLGFLSV